MDHHSVYCVELDQSRMKGGQNPDSKAVYVGSTGLSPEDRFKKHKDGVKANRLVQQFGTKLLPELYQKYNPLPFRKAEEIEQWLASKLRSDGYTVYGGGGAKQPKPAR